MIFVKVNRITTPRHAVLLDGSRWGHKSRPRARGRWHRDASRRQDLAELLSPELSDMVSPWFRDPAHGDKWSFGTLDEVIDRVLADEAKYRETRPLVA